MKPEVSVHRGLERRDDLLPVESGITSMHFDESMEVRIVRFVNEDSCELDAIPTIQEVLAHQGLRPGIEERLQGVGLLHWVPGSPGHGSWRDSEAIRPMMLLKRDLI